MVVAVTRFRSNDREWPKTKSVSGRVHVSNDEGRATKGGWYVQVSLFSAHRLRDAPNKALQPTASAVYGLPGVEGLSGCRGC